MMHRWGGGGPHLTIPKMIECPMSRVWDMGWHEPRSAFRFRGLCNLRLRRRQLRQACDLRDEILDAHNVDPLFLGWQLRLKQSRADDQHDSGDVQLEGDDDDMRETDAAWGIGRPLLPRAPLPVRSRSGPHCFGGSVIIPSCSTPESFTTETTFTKSP